MKSKRSNSGAAGRARGSDFHNYRQVVSRSLSKLDGETVGVKLRFGKKEKDVSEQRFFVPVSVGDSIKVDKDGTWVKPRKREHINYKGGHEIQIKPIWSVQKYICVNGKRISFIIKEIETPEELSAYHELTRFHYRGNGGVGRRIPLIAKMKVWNLPTVAGFVELSSSLLVNVARKKVLDGPFHDTEFDIGWEKWDRDTTKKYTNAIVRISRCVVYPELRGIGLATKLTDGAIEYARERWHIGGLRPCFIEIIAEMLRYWPFVEKNGFIKVGETQGNEKRAPKAMAYLLKRRENGKAYPTGGGGIMTMHRMHAEKLAAIQASKKCTVNEIISLLEKSSDDLSVEDWISLHDIHRRKKPTYMRGLTQSAHDHLVKKMRHLSTSKKHTPQKRTGVLASVEGLRIIASVKPQNSARCRRVQEAFGIVSRKFETELARDFSVEFQAGEVVLVSGTSGVGKSLFLRAIFHTIQSKGISAKLPNGIAVRCRKIARKAHIVRLQKPPQKKAPIELFGTLSLDESMKILARAGLAEAHLFVRPAYALSLGQSYRLALAIALSKKPDIILIDEFCEPLDEYTTAAVCRKLRQAAKNEGICIVVATADARKVLPELRPNRTLLLSSGGKHTWVNTTG